MHLRNIACLSRRDRVVQQRQDLLAPSPPYQKLCVLQPPAHTSLTEFMLSVTASFGVRIITFTEATALDGRLGSSMIMKTVFSHVWHAGIFGLMFIGN